LLTLWKKETEPFSRTEEVALADAVEEFIKRVKRGKGKLPSMASMSTAMIRKGFGHL